MEQLELIDTSPSTIELRTRVPHDEYTEKLAEFFDFRFEGEVVTEIKQLPTLPDDFGIGAIIGPSGSGKSTLLRSINPNHVMQPEWDSTKSVISHFATPEDGIDKFSAVGFNSIPTNDTTIRQTLKRRTIPMRPRTATKKQRPHRRIHISRKPRRSPLNIKRLQTLRQQKRPQRNRNSIMPLRHSRMATARLGI